MDWISDEYLAVKRDVMGNDGNRWHYNEASNIIIMVIL